jgi:hypothetical protein
LIFRGRWQDEALTCTTYVLAGSFLRVELGEQDRQALIEFAESLPPEEKSQ